MQPDMKQDIVAELAKFGARDPEAARLMGVVMALAGEVFVLKAQVQRLTRALHAAGTLSPEQLDAAGRASAMAAWLQAEETAFAGSITAPYLQPDVSADATAWMRKE